ncbi:hypothetical protein AVEN_194385-1 [Araneus ventricosus]|uniref:Uncharacterized protein n=1 Tax=Araneus ventricosus TaxID=182803 RepID=A0A4Y2A6S8_ARAVE|nr:hypothetical protein AVEN_194385-1 [Araneus ventricosus]
MVNMDTTHKLDTHEHSSSRKWCGDTLLHSIYQHHWLRITPIFYCTYLSPRLFRFPLERESLPLPAGHVLPFMARQSKWISNMLDFQTSVCIMPILIGFSH